MHQSLEMDAPDGRTAQVAGDVRAVPHLAPSLAPVLNPGVLVWEYAAIKRPVDPDGSPSPARFLP